MLRALKKKMAYEDDDNSSVTPKNKKDQQTASKTSIGKADDILSGAGYEQADMKNLLGYLN